MYYNFQSPHRVTGPKLIHRCAICLCQQYNLQLKYLDIDREINQEIALFLCELLLLLPCARSLWMDEEEGESKRAGWHMNDLPVF